MTSISKSAALAVAKVRKTRGASRPNNDSGRAAGSFMAAIEAGRMEAVRQFESRTNALLYGNTAPDPLVDFFRAGLQLAGARGFKGAARYLFALGFEVAARALFTSKRSPADEAYHRQGRLDAVQLYLRDRNLLADEAGLRKWLEAGKRQLDRVLFSPENRDLYSALTSRERERNEEMYAKGFLRAVTGALLPRKE